jgi:uncharacterized protein YecE (DUF72 family)
LTPRDEASVRIGCSGWSYEHWKGVLYPESGSSARWLEHYAESFDTVEVNASFYRLPTRKSVARWASATPDDFCFAIKASRYLTHVKRLRSLRDGVARLGERIEPLVRAEKLGPVLWQLPPHFHRDEERLASALRELPAGRHAFEFRDPSWLVDDVYALLREHDAALVVADRAGSPPSPRVDPATWAYLRFHQGRGRDGRYTAAELRRWAERIRSEPGDVYAYFNNDWQGFAIANARTLRELVAASARLAPAGAGKRPDR